MNQEDAKIFMMRDSDIGFDDKKAMNCFGMSKMTVINEKEGS